MARSLTVSPDPFFIVGFQRSGTTMLRLMLNAHPDIAIPHDSAELWGNYREKVRSYNDLASVADIRRMMEDLLAEPRIKSWKTELPRDEIFAAPLPASFPEVMRRFHEVFARAHGKRMWGDKNTGTLVELDKLNAMFPACRIIHIVRDGRDCALSHTGKDYIYGYATIWRAAVEWREQVTLCRKMGAMLPRERFLELRYEDLIQDPEKELGGICDFSGVAYAAEMMKYHETVDANVPAERRGLWPMLDRPPQMSNVYKWKMSMKAVDRAVFERNGGALLREYGYETMPGPIKRGRFKEIWDQIYDRLAWRFAKRSG